jgi:hypothetical protein
MMSSRSPRNCSAMWSTIGVTLTTPSLG